MLKKTKSKRKQTELKVTIIYFVIGILWIYFSDAAVTKVENNFDFLSQLQTIKGILFVFATSLIIYFLIKRESKKQYHIQKKIEVNENEYRLLVENQKDLLVKVDSNGKFLFVNKSYCEFFGKTESELIGNNFMPLVHEDDRLNTTKAMEKLYKPPHTAYLEQRVFSADGWKILSWNDTAILDENNKVIEIIGLGRDITNEKKIIKNLKESEKKYRRLFEKSNDPILIIEGNKFIDCNEATLRLLGYEDKNSIVGKTPNDLSPPTQPDGKDSKEKSEQIISDALLSGYSRFEWVHTNAKNEAIWVEVALTSMKNKGNDVIYTLWRDITKRKTIEKELEESEQKLNLIAENTSDFILIIDENFVAKYVSPSVISVLGFTEEEISNKSIIEFIHKDDLGTIKKRIYKERLNNTKSSTFTNRAVTKNGKTIWIELSIERIFNSEGKIDYSVCIGRDVTQRIENNLELEEALKKATESDKLKSAFLANMSHEIRTPLNGIIGFSEILATDEDLDLESRISYSGIIKNSSNQLLSIISDILDISKIESQQIELSLGTISPLTLLSDMYSTYGGRAKQKGLQLNIESHNNAKTIKLQGDSQRVRQVFSNLITNAIKFTNTGSITIGFDKVKEQYAFYVQDTGIGIEEEYKSKVFERFMQAENSHAVKFGGTGLGLSICRSLVELMQGEIWLTSEYGQGTTFYFALPVINESRL